MNRSAMEEDSGDAETRFTLKEVEDDDNEDEDDDEDEDEDVEQTKKFEQMNKTLSDELEKRSRGIRTKSILPLSH